MISMFVSNAVECGFEPWSDQTKDNKIDICCFSTVTLRATLRRKSKDWFAQNRDNVSERRVERYVYTQICFSKLAL
jgi:hypothetical protein